ncbi:Spo0E family sporulation regulatory protein-aspartic acid phosphatase [Alteribacillus sp. HJP-4]|uniref:Spo0E family sporulation regulatory protein-aspartic acid phosphatase n=1 Tax=Alteribacillus sp. HJP-4 TaxID=2775394 RepID=UPI0035CD3213
MSEINRYEAQGDKLEILRRKMVRAASIYGFDHPLVLHYSRRIDQQHNNLLGLNNSRASVGEESVSERKSWQMI